MENNEQHYVYAIQLLGVLLSCWLSCQEFVVMTCFVLIRCCVSRWKCLDLEFFSITVKNYCLVLAKQHTEKQFGQLQEGMKW